MKLAKKLGLSYLVMGLLPLLLFGFVIFTMLNTTLKSNTYSELSSRNQSKKHQIEEYFHQKENDLVTLASTVEVLRSEAFSKLEAISKIKQSAVNRYFDNIQNQIITFSEDIMIVEAMSKFPKSFKDFDSQSSFLTQDRKNTLKRYYDESFSTSYKVKNKSSIDMSNIFSQLDDETLSIQSAYIGDNENGLGDKHLLDYQKDGSDYSKLHKKYHPVVRDYLEKFEYYDIFLIDKDSGKIVYSVFKELDYGTSLLTGPYSKTNFSEAFRKARDLNKGEFVLVDYEKYLPSYEDPASFIAAPIFDGDESIGVLIFQMPISRLNTIMSEREGLGKTGETYLVGSDHLMRSDSYLDPVNRSVQASFKYPSKGRVDTVAVENALQGESASSIIIDYNNNLVLSSYMPIQLSGFSWALMAEIDVSEAFAPSFQGKRQVKDLKWQNDYFSKFIQNTGYYDLFLIDPSGYCFYSVTKEADYHTNLLTGPYKDSGLGKVVHDIIEKKKVTAFSDFAPYAPSNNAPASFLGRAIQSKGKTELVLVVQLSSDKINDLAQRGSSYTEKIESYLLGFEGQLRSNVFLDNGFTLEKSFASNKKVQTEAFWAATQSGKSKFKQKDTQIISNYNSKKVLSSWDTINIFDQSWIIVTEKDRDTAMAVLESIKSQLLWITCIVILILVFVVRLVDKKIISTILKTADFADKLSLGDIRVRLDLSDSSKLDQDELYDMSVSLNKVASNLETRADIALLVADGDLTQEFNVLSKDDVLGDALNHMNSNLKSVIHRIQEVSGIVIDNSKELSKSTISLANASTTQAASLEEISASIKEVSNQSNQNSNDAESASDVTLNTKKKIDLSNAQMKKLVDAMEKIEGSSKSIQQINRAIDDIAFQTNLLALNAAIEAARAGVHGKGFAVVAEEVRTLASRSLKASQETADLIESSTKDIKDGVTFVNETSDSLQESLNDMDQLESYVSNIANSSKQQALAIAEMTTGLDQVSSVSHSSASFVDQTSTASDELTHQIDDMNQLLSQFLVTTDPLIEDSRDNLLLD